MKGRRTVPALGTDFAGSAERVLSKPSTEVLDESKWSLTHQEKFPAGEQGAKVSSMDHLDSYYFGQDRADSASHDAVRTQWGL